MLKRKAANGASSEREGAKPGGADTDTIFTKTFVQKRATRPRQPNLRVR